MSGPDLHVFITLKFLALCSFSHREKLHRETGKPCSGPVLALYGIAVYYTW